MDASFILLVILTLFRLGIAVRLFLTARNSNLKNIYWLAGLFALGIYSIFTPLTTSPLKNYWFFHLGFILGHFCLAMFIHTTFHRSRYSPVSVILGLIILAFFVDIYALAVDNLVLAGIMTGVGLVNWAWHFIVSWQAYRTIADDVTVEDWVKARYLLMLTYVVLIVFSSLQVFLSSTNFIAVPSFVTALGILFVILSIIFQFLVWVMPESFRKWLNRNQQARTEERLHEQALAVFNIIGTAMSEGSTGLSTIAALFSIRKAISQELKTEDSAQVEKHALTLGYKGWLDLLNNPELYILVKGSGAKDPHSVLDNAKRALIEKQSLFTMQVK